MRSKFFYSPPYKIPAEEWNEKTMGIMGARVGVAFIKPGKRPLININKDGQSKKGQPEREYIPACELFGFGS